MSLELMRRLTVLSYKKDTRALIRRLTYLRCVDIQSTEIVGEGFTLERFDASADKTSAEEKLCEIVRACDVLCGYKKKKWGLSRRKRAVDVSAFVTGERYPRAQEVVAETEQAARELSDLYEREKEKLSLLESLLPFRAYPRPLGLKGTKYTEIILGSVPAGTDHSELAAVIDSFYATAERVLYKEDSDTFLCVIAHVSDTDAVMEKLLSYGFVRAEFPKEYSHAGREIARVEKELHELRACIGKTKAKLARLATQLDELEILYDVEKTTLNIIEQQSKLGQTEETDVLCAWVPKSCEKKVALALEGYDAAYEFRDPRESEIPPILFTGVMGAIVSNRLLRRIGLFKKIYEGGGEPFAAISPSEKYTVEK